ncbi:MAG: BamA/TamA family outer membrane protein [Ignavibacteria bacterium]|nr:BamA/TamA family outer membrane protein [Ignavibacteria bacterium]
MKYFRFTILVLILSPCLVYSQREESEVTDYIIEDVNIQFTGTGYFEEDDILAVLQTPKSEYFNPSEIALDIRRIDKFYFDNGFFDVQIDTLFSFIESDKEVRIIFKITENQPYYIKEIEYNGLENIYIEAYKEIFTINTPLVSKGQRYNKDLLLSEISRIIKILNNNGYATALSDQPEVTKYISATPGTSNNIKIRFNFITGDFYRFGKTYTEIPDNRDNIAVPEIHKELEYRENDIYSKKVLTESENRLSRINILENARIQIKDIDSANKIINLTVTASLTNKYEVEPELAAYDITNRFFAGAALSFTDKYFLGGGRRFITKVTGLVHAEDIYLMELSLQLFQPYIFNNNKITGNLDLSGSFLRDETIDISTLKNIIGINYELPRHTYINNLFIDWETRNERFTVNSPHDSINGVSSFQTNLFSSVIGITTVHNNTDNFIFPTSGNYQSYLLQESGLLSMLIEQIFSTSTYKYIKLMNVSKFYYNFYPERATSVLATKFLIGVIFEYGQNPLRITELNRETGINRIPIEWRFIAGGSISVRGWGGRKLGTFPLRENGGNFILEGSFEHRTRPFLNTEGLFKDLGFVTFLDFGNLWEKPSNFKIPDIAIAIGAGIRYYTIVGPVRFDIGFKLYDYEAETNKWLFQNSMKVALTNKIAFQFGIGHTF